MDVACSRSSRSVGSMTAYKSAEVGEKASVDSLDSRPLTDGEQ